MKRQLSGLWLVGVLAMVLSVPANALPYTVFELGNIDPPVLDFYMPDGPDWVASAQYGNAALDGNWELSAGLNTSNSADFNEAQFAWGNGQWVQFSLAVIGSNLVFTVGQTTVNYGAVLNADLLFIRLAGGPVESDRRPDSESNVAGIKFGNALDGYGPEYYSNGQNDVINYLLIDGWDGGPITGLLQLAWGDDPLGARPAIQFMGGGKAVPEPATMAMVGLGLAAAAWKRRTV